MKPSISFVSAKPLCKTSTVGKLRIIGTLLLSLFVLTSSCRKDRQTPAYTSTKDSEVMGNKAPLNPTWEPSNKRNPYDNVGALHNILLDSAQAYIDITGDTTRSGIHERIAQVFHGATGINPRLSLSKVDPAVDYAIAIHGERALDNYKIPANVKRYLDRLWFEINTVQDADFPTLKGRIIRLEEEILSDKSLGEDGRRVLLSTTSIARYSTAHWFSWATGTSRVVLAMGLIEAAKAAIKAGMADAAAMLIGWVLHLPYDVITDMSAAVSSIVYHNLMDR